jgi:hypothetical protein
MEPQSNKFKIPSMDFMIYFAAAESIFPNLRALCTVIKGKEKCRRFRTEIEEKQGLLYNELLAVRQEFIASVPKLERAILPSLKSKYYLKLIPVTPDALFEHTISFYNGMKDLVQFLRRIAPICLSHAELLVFLAKMNQFDIQLRPLITAKGYREYALNYTDVPLKKLGFSEEMTHALSEFIRHDATMQLSSEFFFEELRRIVEEICLVNSQI